jgi:hypothetical protein
MFSKGQKQFLKSILHHISVLLKAAVNILQNLSEILSFTIKFVCASPKLKVQNYQRLT